MIIVLLRHCIHTVVTFDTMVVIFNRVSSHIIRVPFVMLRPLLIQLLLVIYDLREFHRCGFDDLSKRTSEPDYFLIYDLKLDSF